MSIILHQMRESDKFDVLLTMLRFKEAHREPAVKIVDRVKDDIKLATAPEGCAMLKYSVY